MRTTLRTTIAVLDAIATLTISAVAAAGTDPGLDPEPLPGQPSVEDSSGDGDGDGGGAAAICLEGAEDCDDMIVPGDDGQTEPGSGGGGVPGDPGDGMAMCAEGHPDCNDIIVGDPGAPCGEEVVQGEGPDATVSYTPCDTDELPMPTEPSITEPTPGMANVYARPFDTATVGDDDVTLTIDFVSGIEPCYVLDHVDVDYGSDTVTITLFEGSDVSGGEVACIEIGVFKRTVITLDQPLAGRTILDGAAA